MFEYAGFLIGVLMGFGVFGFFGVLWVFRRFLFSVGLFVLGWGVLLGLGFGL